MQTSVITEQPELMQFLEEVQARLGDPSRATCLVFVEYGEVTGAGPVPALLASYDVPAGSLTVTALDEMAMPTMEIPVPLAGGDDPAIQDGQLAAFGIRKVALGLWTLNPSLNIPGAFHGYVVVHGVPDPAPWERTILLATEVPGGMAMGTARTAGEGGRR